MKSPITRACRVGVCATPLVRHRSRLRRGRRCRGGLAIFGVSAWPIVGGAAARGRSSAPHPAVANRVSPKGGNRSWRARKPASRRRPKTSAPPAPRWGALAGPSPRGAACWPPSLPRSARAAPQPRRWARASARPRSPSTGAGGGPWFAGLHHGGRADGPYPRGRTEAARLPGPIVQLWLHVRRWPSLGRLPQAGAPRPALLAAAVPWLTLPGRAMADARWAWPGGTGQHWQEPAVPQWL